MKRRRALLLSITIVLALCAVCGLWLHRERQQYALNRLLITALEHGDLTKALALINAGADPNTRQVPLPAPSLKLLLAYLLHHAPPSHQSPTALMFACDTYIFTLPDALSFADDHPLFQAMLTHGADVHAIEGEHRTALHFATKRGRLHTVELLLQHKADVNAQDSRKITPLMEAINHNQAEVAHLLLLHGANPNMEDNIGRAVLYYAIEELYDNTAEDFITDLLAHGANPNLPNRYGVSPLQFAQHYGQPRLVRLLKQHGAK